MHRGLERWGSPSFLCLVPIAETPLKGWQWSCAAGPGVSRAEHAPRPQREKTEAQRAGPQFSSE